MRFPLAFFLALGLACGETGENQQCFPLDGAAAGNMVSVPSGPFLMGCNESIDLNCESDEFPYHEVTLSEFEIDETEVTQSAYAACVDAGCCSEPINWDPAKMGEHPVISLSWEQARAYCDWAGKRLPTEAEWEKAARGTDERIYPWGSNSPTCDLANFENCEGETLPVASLPAGASPYGAMDMAGNVSEWVQDWYAETYYSDSPMQDPPGPKDTDTQVARGGGQDHRSFEIRASERSWLGSDQTGPGFRCAR